MSKLLYMRVSTGDQSIEAQRQAMEQEFGKFDKVFSDEGVSGGVLAANRPGFGALMNYAREGDTIYVYAVDRLGRDAIDVQLTIRTLISHPKEGGKGAQVHIKGLGLVVGDAGKLIVSVLAQCAEMERNRIRERTQAGREAAKASLAAIGKTHRGKTSLGRPVKADASTVRVWRSENKKSISETAKHFKLSEATVKRYCATV